MSGIDLTKAPLMTTCSPAQEVPSTSMMGGAMGMKPACDEGFADGFVGPESMTLNAAAALARGGVMVADTVACSVENAAAAALEGSIEAVETLGGGMIDAGADMIGGVQSAYTYVTGGIVAAWHWLVG
jgi:hypothetical protein